MYIVIQTKLFKSGSRWVEFSADWCKWHNYQTIRVAHEVRSLYLTRKQIISTYIVILNSL